jgi:hypothetical protein
LGEVLAEVATVNAARANGRWIEQSRQRDAAYRRLLTLSAVDARGSIRAHRCPPLHGCEGDRTRKIAHAGQEPAGEAIACLTRLCVSHISRPAKR